MKAYDVKVTVTYTYTVTVPSVTKEEAKQRFMEDIDCYMQEVLNKGDEAIDYEVVEE